MGFIILGIILTAVYYLARIIFKKSDDKISVAFFHPYCNDGGGGERVLWKMIEILQKEDKNNHLDIVVYCGDKGINKEYILSKISSQFGIKDIRSENLNIIFLKTRYLCEAKYYPYFTILLQSIGSIFLGLEALWRFNPTVFIDTVGYSFTLPIFRYLGSCYVACYIHYPTISTEMLLKVKNRIDDFNNSDIAKSTLKTNAKLFYYNIFAKLYKIMGRSSHLTMVNSNWTKAHISRLWDIEPILVYPPCNTFEFQSIPLENRKKQIISLAQYRPEKNHVKQIEIMRKICETNSELKLKIIGSCRAKNEKDQKILEQLKLLVNKYNLEDRVEIFQNINFEKIKILLGESLFGLHTMENEHFGISIVEMKASGLITIAHNSGGPKMDIMEKINNDDTGFLADTVEDYVKTINDLCKMEIKELKKIQKNARNSSVRFSDEEFSIKMANCFRKIPAIKKIIEQ